MCLKTKKTIRSKPLLRVQHCMQGPGLAPPPALPLAARVLLVKWGRAQPRAWGAAQGKPACSCRWVAEGANDGDCASLAYHNTCGANGHYCAGSMVCPCTALLACCRLRAKAAHQHLPAKVKPHAGDMTGKTSFVSSCKLSGVSSGERQWLLRRQRVLWLCVAATVGADLWLCCSTQPASEWIDCIIETAPCSMLMTALCTIQSTGRLQRKDSSPPLCKRPYGWQMF